MFLAALTSRSWTVSRTGQVHVFCTSVSPAFFAPHLERRLCSAQHNHPSGEPEPSHADRILTDQLVAALATVEVRVLDHLIIGDGACVSFSERGLL